MNSNHPDPLAPALQQALEWQVVLWSGEVTESEQRRFERWLAQAAAHREAWQAVQRFGDRLSGLPGAVGAQVLRSPPSRGRRKLLLSLGGLAGASLLAYGIGQTPHWQVATAAHRTRVGERRQLLLANGIRVDLNSASALDVGDAATRPCLALRRGEIVVSGPAIPADRPALSIQTAFGLLESRGGSLHVRQDTDHVHVAALSGDVTIRPAQDNTTHVLDAGLQARFDARQSVVEGPANPQQTAWINGRIVAERMRLADFITELSRHRNGVLRSDPAIADLIVSGVFPLDDTNRILAALAEALPVKVRTITPYWVTLLPR